MKPVSNLDLTTLIILPAKNTMETVANQFLVGAAVHHVTRNSRFALMSRKLPNIPNRIYF